MLLRRILVCCVVDQNAMVVCQALPAGNGIEREGNNWKLHDSRPMPSCGSSSPALLMEVWEVTGATGWYGRGTAGLAVKWAQDSMLQNQKYDVVSLVSQSSHLLDAV